ncbi:GNAT family N-acetyltransferase [Parabacteroides sp. OttesenSCG-928-N08]|nr:GNAT family N-acetyltransferase [Parabacteroides sp. OttesenSCG-928-N08]
MSIIIKEVTSRKELKEFVKFNIQLYKDNPYHVPVLIEDELNTLDKTKNPAFEQCEAVYYLAYKEGKIVGRIAGIISHPSNKAWNEQAGRFGFVDFIDDDEVVNALFNAVEEWVKEKGMKSIYGPMGFTDMDHEGMLVMGFDQPGTTVTIYNHAYYPKQLERIGYGKLKDWHEFKIYIPEAVPEKHLRIGEIVKKKYGLKIMKFTKTKDLLPYAQKVFLTLNQAFKPLFGFAPLTQKQIDYYIKIYIPILRLDLVTLIVREEDEEVVGFGISLPNLTEAMQKAKGKMLPFGWYHLLKTLKSKPKVVDLYLTGVLPEYQGKGVNALLFNDLIPIYKNLGVVYAESNPELETNSAVQAQWDYFKREHHKTRRAYGKEL